MSDDFDPYQQWLDIPRSEQPPHHYRLLGLPIFEADVAKVRAEADRRMQHVRTFQLGKRSQVSQTILNELAAARVCLLNPASKARYDAALTEWLNARLPVPPPVLPPEELPQQAVSTQSGSSGGVPIGKRHGWGAVLGIVVVTLIASGITLYFRQRPNKSVSTEAAVDAKPPVALPQSRDTSSARLGGKTVIVPENVVAQTDDGDVHLNLARAKVTGPTLHYNDEGTVGWSSPADRIEWEFLIHKPGIFRIEVTYAADTSSAGSKARFVLSDRAAPLIMNVRDTGSDSQFVTDPVDKMFTIRRGGRYTLTISALEQRGSVLMRLKQVELHRAPVR